MFFPAKFKENWILLCCLHSYDDFWGPPMRPPMHQRGGMRRPGPPMPPRGYVGKLDLQWFTSWMWDKHEWNNPKARFCLNLLAGVSEQILCTHFGHQEKTIMDELNNLWSLLLGNLYATNRVYDRYLCIVCGVLNFMIVNVGMIYQRVNGCCPNFCLGSTNENLSLVWFSRSEVKGHCNEDYLYRISHR